MRRTIRDALKSIGFPPSRMRDAPAAPKSLHAAAIELMSAQERVRIVQVGANDGKFNDPVYPVTSEFPDRTDILLIEPQRDLIPYLTKNYRFHPKPIIHNGAVGPLGDLILYSVRKEYWSSLRVNYADSWPEYRAPTGVTSAGRHHVESWLQSVLPENDRLDDMIEESSVPSAPLLSILESHGWNGPIDILQIDAEGFDDQVIYQSSIGTIRPRIINFEHTVLAKADYQALRTYLQDQGYSIFKNAADTLALKPQP